MIYLITGVTSFLGLELSNQLLASGNKVYGICRRESLGIKELPTHPNFTPLFSEMSEMNTLSIPEPIDTFIHLAWAGTNHAGRNQQSVHEENYQYSIDAMHWAAKLKAKLFVDAGSQAEYGFHWEEITETSPCNPISEYGKAKLKVYEAGKENCPSLGMSYLHLRIFSLFGEKDHPWTLIQMLINKMKRNETVDLTSCEQWWNFLYVKDGAKQIRKLIQIMHKETNGSCEVCHIASEDSRILKEFVERVKELMESNSTLNYGAIVPSAKVSLNPSVEKTKNMTGFISDYSFDDVIKRIINN